MDHEVVPRPCKICDWLLDFSWDHFGLHQGRKKKKLEQPWSMRSSKYIFEGPRYLLTWSNKFCGVKRQKRRSTRKRQRHIAEKCCGNIFFDEIFSGKRRRRQEKTKEWSNLMIFFPFQNCPFWTYISKIPTYSLFGAWSLLLAHIRFPLSEEPKSFVKVILFFKFF